MKFIIKAIPDSPGRDCWVCSITDDDFRVSINKGKALHFDSGNIDNTIRRLLKIQAGYGLFSFQTEPAPQLEIPEPPSEPFRF